MCLISNAWGKISSLPYISTLYTTPSEWKKHKYKGGKHLGSSFHSSLCSSWVWQCGPGVLVIGRGKPFLHLGDADHLTLYQSQATQARPRSYQTEQIVTWCHGVALCLRALSCSASNRYKLCFWKTCGERGGRMNQIPSGIIESWTTRLQGTSRSSGINFLASCW